MKRRTRHIRAANDEWIAVHRENPTRHSKAGSGGGGDWAGELVGGIILFVIVMVILKDLLPLMILGFGAMFIISLFNS
jgi:hypothetical protein